jgi:hypothetical protein
MGSSAKKKTTMAKFARENRLRERRLTKQAKKDARKQASPDQLDVSEAPLEGVAESTRPDSPPAADQPDATDDREVGDADDREDARDAAASAPAGQEQPIGLARVGGGEAPSVAT